MLFQPSFSFAQKREREKEFRIKKVHVISTSQSRFRVFAIRIFLATYLRLRWIYEFDFSADRSALLFHVHITGSNQSGFVGRLVLSVQVKGNIDLKCSGLLRLWQVVRADNSQLAVRQSQNRSCQKK